MGLGKKGRVGKERMELGKMDGVGKVGEVCGVI